MPYLAYRSAGCETVASISPLRMASYSCGMPSFETIEMCPASPAFFSIPLDLRVCSVGAR
jgi:hypothetical protein